jgi:hypothetical protein
MQNSDSSEKKVIKKQYGITLVNYTDDLIESFRIPEVSWQLLPSDPKKNMMI